MKYRFVLSILLFSILQISFADQGFEKALEDQVIKDEGKNTKLLLIALGGLIFLAILNRKRQQNNKKWPKPSQRPVNTNQNTAQSKPVEPVAIVAPAMDPPNLHKPEEMKKEVEAEVDVYSDETACFSSLMAQKEKEEEDAEDVHFEKTMIIPNKKKPQADDTVMISSINIREDAIDINNEETMCFKSLGDSVDINNEETMCFKSLSAETEESDIGFEQTMIIPNRQNKKPLDEKADVPKLRSTDELAREKEQKLN